jgi:hypothetical protein
VRLDGAAAIVVVAALVGAAPSRAATRELPPPSRGAEASTVLLAPLRIDGELSSATRADLSRKLAEGLRRSAVEAREATEACGDLTCRMDEARERGASHVVEAALVVDDRVYDVTITAYAVNTPRERIEVGERCEVCGVAEVAELVARQAAALGDRLREPGPAVAELSIISEPAGARIFVDGEDAGRTPLRVSLPPGPHRVRATLPDHAPLERNVEAQRGTRETVHLRLSPVDAPVRAPRPRTWAAGWALFGIGTAALVPGITLLAIDGRGQRSRCSGVDRDAEGDCRFRWNTTVHGAAIVAVGAALIATGVGLIVAGRHRKKRRE